MKHISRLAAIGGAAIALSLTAGPALANPYPVEAHVASITGVAACPILGQWQVVWTIANEDDVTATVVSTDPDSDAEGKTIAADASVTATAIVLPLTAVTASMTASLDWGNDQIETATSILVQIPLACVPAETTAPPTTTPPPTTPAPTATVPPPPPPATTEPPTQSPEPTATGVFFPNCDAVRAAGKAPLLRGQPGYRPDLDSDSDGIACEVPGSTEAPIPIQPVGNEGALPNTGPAPLIPLLAVGGALLAGGTVLLVAGRRRRMS